MSRTLTNDERETLEAALENARQTQTDFWMALGDLESLLDSVEVDENRDLEEITVDDLLEMEPS